ncbi:MAG: hypothetical protein IPH72_32830, partial [Sandaracinaceae bacterium]|nr:hypothetical protein [Sandaracinaceae bacterium]
MKQLLRIPSFRSLTLPLGALLLTACGAASADPSDSHDTPPPPAQVRVAEASEGPVASSYIVTGPFRSLNPATLTSRMMGYVETLDVAVGERVVRDQLLATLDDADPRAGLLQANAGTLEAQAARAQYEQQSAGGRGRATFSAHHPRAHARAAGRPRRVRSSRRTRPRRPSAPPEAQYEASRSVAEPRRLPHRAEPGDGALGTPGIDYTACETPFDGVVLADPPRWASWP